MKRSKIAALIALLLALVLVLGSCGADTTAKKKKQENAQPTAVVTEAPAATAAPEATEAPEETGPIIEPQAIADYIFEHGELPPNFITKKEAQALGWDSSWNYVSDVAPGMSIGGDYYGNYERLLPKVENRLYYEADCFYHGGKRNQYRIVFSNDCHVWYTEDHYQTFIELFPSKEESE